MGRKRRGALTSVNFGGFHMEMTREVQKAAAALGLSLHGHVDIESEEGAHKHVVPQLAGAISAPHST
jgi:hypothetical protein